VDTGVYIDPHDVASIEAVEDEALVEPEAIPMDLE